MQQWFLESGGGVTGPHSGVELSRLVQDGRLGPADRVSLDRVAWLPVEAVRGLLGQTGTAPETAPTVEVSRITFPGYEVLGILGKGGMGVVYRARQLKLGRLVALKTVPFAPGASDTAARRFAKEAEVLAQLSHPNIVQIFDFHSDGQAGCFAMELLDGEDLQARIDRAGPLSEAAAWAIARQAASALAHAARQGILHRDVKPGNLFLVSSHGAFGLPADAVLAKVTDFGLALRDSRDESQARLTAAGLILGTPVYMAPEQATGVPIDHRADLYALGATVYHALSGRPPFAGDTIWEVLAAKAKGTPRLSTPVSAETGALVADLMAADPARRVATYEELLTRIDELPAMRGPGAPAPRPMRRRPWWLLAAALAVALTAGGVWWWWPKPARPALRYVGTGTSELLFDGKNLPPWLPTGGAWRVENDAEGTPVLAGTAGIRRRFRPYQPDFRVTLGLDLHEASSVEVALEGDATVLRLSRGEGVVAGRVADGGFSPLGEVVAYPTPQQLQGKVPYREVRIEQAGGRRTFWFDGRPVAAWPAVGPLREAALTLRAEGGKMRIQEASQDELRPAEASDG